MADQLFSEYLEAVFGQKNFDCSQTLFQQWMTSDQKDVNKTLKWVVQSGLNIKYVKVQTPEICLAAVKQEGEALQYVKDQSPEIYLAAVKQDGNALQYIKDQSPEVCLAAVKQNGYALPYVKDQSPEVCLAAVKEYGDVLRYVKDQTPEICLAAVKQNKGAFKFVNKELLKNMIEEKITATNQVDNELAGRFNSKNTQKVDKVRLVQSIIGNSELNESQKLKLIESIVKMDC